MALQITHTTVATLPDQPGVEINKNEWNDNHAITGTIDQTQNNIAVDGVTITGSGTPGSPLVSHGTNGTVTTVSITTANGINGSVSNPTTAPTISLTLGAIAPSSVTSSGTISASNLSGTNTGDQTNIIGNAATVSSINGLVTAGGNISLSGSGNTASAYSISSIDNNPKNRIIDGAFNVDQIWQNNVQTIAAGSYVSDQWKYQATQASKISSQVTAGAIANGYPNNLSIAVLATAAIGASDYFLIQQPIEGCNIPDFKFGTTAASAVSLQFNINTSQTGTWSGSLGNSAGNRSYPFTFNVPSANVTTNIQIQNIPGDQSGTWLNSPNTIGVNLNLCLGAGSTFVGTSGTWAASNLYGATGTVNLLATMAATAKITAVQLEIGAFCTNYETKSYPYELWQCSRHYTLVNEMIASINGTGAVQAHFAVPAPMMKIPTVSFTGTASIGIPGVATYTSTAQPSSNVDNPYNSIIQLNQTGFNTGAVASGFGFLFQASYYRVAAQF